jgi:DNA-binding response OmpR family regulator
MTKPFDERILLAHVHSLLWRTQKREPVSQSREGEQVREEQQSSEEDAYIVDWYIRHS